MEWHFKCPLCKSWCRAEWGVVEERSKCNSCHKFRVIPGPADQHDAWVDQHDWPVEMEEVVHELKGTKCVISGCRGTEMTLDHIIAWEKDGPTSVSNLQPMCKSQNSSKNDMNLAVWLKEIGEQLRQ